MAYNRVSVTTSPTLIVDANNKRRQIIVDNQSSASVFLGPDASITTSNTISLRANSTLEFDDRWHRGAIYGVVATGTANVAYWETEG